MSELQNPSILLDVDCIWTKRDEDLFEVLMCGNNLLLQDTYQNSLRPDKKNHDLNMKDMSELYKTIPINSFKSEHAIRYGGELIGGSSEQLKIIANKLLLTIDYCKEQYDLGNEIQFNNGFSIFSGMEFISSYIYNSLPDVNIYDTFGKFSKRLWTNIQPNNVKEKDIELTIWHLPAEKDSGLKELFNEIIQDSSLFWEMNYGFEFFLGKYVGIPKRN